MSNHNVTNLDEVVASAAEQLGAMLDHDHEGEALPTHDVGGLRVVTVTGPDYDGPSYVGNGVDSCTLDHEEAGAYTWDTIRPTESAARYGRRTRIVADDDDEAGPPAPMPYVFTGFALHPFLSGYSSLLVGRCRHCWGTREQHTY